MNKLTLRQKLWLPLLLTWLGLLTLTSWNALQARNLQLQERRADLRNIVELAASIAQGLEQDARTGKLSEGAARREAIARISELRYGDSGYLTIQGTDLVMVMHPMNPALNGTDMSTAKDARGVEFCKAIAAVGSSEKGGGFVEYWWQKPGENNASEKLGYVQRFGPWKWYLIAGAYEDDIRADFYTTLLRSLAALVVLGAIVTTLTVATSRSIRRSLGGEPTQAKDAARRIAAGDLTSSSAVIAHEMPRDSVLGEIEATRSELSNTVSNVKTAVEAMNLAAGEIAHGNTNLSVRTEQQAASLQETAAALDELTATVRQNAENAAQAFSVATTAAADARQGGQIVTAVVGDVQEIAASSKRVAEITGVIDGIAFQTNILALNAAVEAARAGDAGRGFAVVASEVRTLAQRSATAAREIRELVQTSLAQIASGVQNAGVAGSAMKKIVHSVERVTAIVDEITSASDEQSRGLAEINKAVAQMDGVTQHNAALVEQSASAANALKDEAAKLDASVSKFRLGL
jgi:methyl-accepting chemotaxis protein